MTLEIVVVENRAAALQTMCDLIARLDTEVLWGLAEIFSEGFRDDLADSPLPMLHVHSGELEPSPYRAMCLQTGSGGMGMFEP